MISQESSPSRVSGRLSVIVPFVNENPQIMFTAQALYSELRGEIDFEMMFVNNWCKECEDQNRIPDKGGEHMAGFTKLHPWLKYLEYTKKLSHWQSKNLGVQNSTGEFLWFCDSHCIPSKDSIVKMYDYYRLHWRELHGTLHFPLSYMMDAPGRELIYKLVTDLERAVVHYSFTTYRQYDQTKVIQVPCMSTCGMMMHRDIFNELGGWPEELGIYGGGENFINFTLAVLGYSVNIFPSFPLFHYAAPRGYSWNYNDFHRNRTISSLMYGGPDFAKKYIKHVKGSPGTLLRIYEDVMIKCSDHRKHIESRQVMAIEEWVEKWQPQVRELAGG
jgi:hypothetical protein